MSEFEAAADRSEYAFACTWISSMLSRYCLAVDAQSIDDVLAVLNDAAVYLRDARPITGRAELKASYTSVFSADPHTRHQLAPLAVELERGRCTFNAAYLRFDTSSATPTLSSIGVYRGTFDIDPVPRWLTLRVTSP